MAGTEGPQAPQDQPQEDPAAKPPAQGEVGDDTFEVVAERFADIRILRYRVPGFEALPLKQKELLYYLYEAGLAGRDIIYDQNYKYNLLIRRTLEGIVRTYKGDREAPAFAKLLEYTKRVWFSQGIHHHYSSKKLEPGFTREDLAAFVAASDPEALPLAEGQSVDALVAALAPHLFDPEVGAVRVSRAEGVDLVRASANNFYEGVTQAEVEAFYAHKTDADPARPISHGLNSKLVKEDGRVVEKVWKVGGMYSAALERVVAWLDKAIGVAESDAQRDALERLVTYLRSGDLADFDRYSVAWVDDTESEIDVVNGFIETYGDPLDMRGSYESMVSIRDAEATRRIAAISGEAQWFEAHSPIADAHKKPDVKGISARVINVVAGSGDASPTFPLGVNLPNADWIRKEHGSKSVNLGNIANAYDEANKHSGLVEEFSPSPEIAARDKAHGTLADNLHTDLHEVIGHASGRLDPGVAPPNETLKSYGGTLEEARADLVGLYFLLDPKLIEIGVMDTLDVGKAAYDAYIRNGLMTQLARIELGDDLQQTHMRNRQLVAGWAFAKGAADKVIERVVRDGETYFAVRDYQKLRGLFGQLLAELQRIKSEGDFEAGKALVETYGVKVDRALHEEVLERYAKLNIPPWNGFINPKLTAVREGDEIVDVKITYPDDFTAQMLDYAAHDSFLPTFN